MRTTDLLTVGEVAHRSGVAPSALRYYESVGLIRPVERVNKQRRYQPEVLNRLAIIETARQAGFSLPAIAQLLAGFEGNPAQNEGPWSSLARQQILRPRMPRYFGQRKLHLRDVLFRHKAARSLPRLALLDS